MAAISQFYIGVPLSRRWDHEDSNRNVIIEAVEVPEDEFGISLLRILGPAEYLATCRSPFTSKMNWVPTNGPARVLSNWEWRAQLYSIDHNFDLPKRMGIVNGQVRTFRDY